MWWVCPVRVWAPQCRCSWRPSLTSPWSWSRRLLLLTGATRAVRIEGGPSIMRAVSALIWWTTSLAPKQSFRKVIQIWFYVLTRNVIVSEIGYNSFKKWCFPEFSRYMSTLEWSAVSSLFSFLWRHHVGSIMLSLYWGTKNMILFIKLSFITRVWLKNRWESCKRDKLSFEYGGGANWGRVWKLHLARQSSCINRSWHRCMVLLGRCSPRRKISLCPSLLWVLSFIKNKRGLFFSPLKNSVTYLCQTLL